MKKIEKANIIHLHHNILVEKLPIVSITLDYEDGCSSQGTDGYTGTQAINFINNLMTILNIKDENQIEGKLVSACTEYYQLLAIGNESENKWIDLKNVDKIIEGNIIKYFERKVNNSIER